MALLQKFTTEQALHLAAFQATKAPPSSVVRYNCRVVSLLKPPPRCSSNLATSPCRSLLWSAPFTSQKKVPRVRRLHSASLKPYSAKEASDWEREESRWKREEQRWIREEQRWLREESRWEKERAQLKSQISQLEHETVLLRASKYQVWPSSSPVPPSPAAPRTIDTGAAPELPSPPALEQNLLSKGIQAEELIAAVASRTPTALFPATSSSSSSSGSGSSGNGSSTSQLSRSPLAVTPPLPAEATASSLAETNIFRSLKPGAEGDDVKALQEALMSVGFYSGEDEMELAFFDAGTSSAVMSWQASVGVAEDGVITPALFAQLLEGGRAPAGPTTPQLTGEAAGRPTFAAFTGMHSTERGMPVTNEERPSPLPSRSREDPKWKPESERFARSALEADMEGTPHRVFLLGENRWEDPQRTVGGVRGPAATPQQGVVAGQPHKSCFQCKGAGRLICMDCDGTGEINVEEQFLEWVDGAGCPYCEGNSFLVCDTCQGTGKA